MLHQNEGYRRGSTFEKWWGNSFVYKTRLLGHFLLYCLLCCLLERLYVAGEESQTTGIDLFGKFALNTILFYTSF